MRRSVSPAAMAKLPWPTSEYRKLDPKDLEPRPAPTDAQRIRVAAALATAIRDGNIRGKPVDTTAEAIRAVLTMSAEAWARDIGSVRGFVEAYDTADPRTRLEQTKRQHRFGQ